MGSEAALHSGLQNESKAAPVVPSCERGLDRLSDCVSLADCAESASWMETQLHNLLAIVRDHADRKGVSMVVRRRLLLVLVHLETARDEGVFGSHAARGFQKGGLK